MPYIAQFPKFPNLKEITELKIPTQKGKILKFRSILFGAHVALAPCILLGLRASCGYKNEKKKKKKQLHIEKEKTKSVTRRDG